MHSHPCFLRFGRGFGRGFLLAGLFLALAVGSLHAQIIHSAGSGVVYGTTNMGGLVSDGMSFTFSFDADLSAPTSVNTGIEHDLAGAVSNFNFDIGSGAYAGTLNGMSLELVNQSFPSDDEFRSVAHSGPALGGRTLQVLSVNFHDSSGTVFNSTAMPTSLSLSSFDTAFLAVQFDTGFFRATISSFDYAPSAAAVPEPSTWAALAGATSLGFAAWRRRVRRVAAAA